MLGSIQASAQAMMTTPPLLVSNLLKKRFLLNVMSVAVSKRSAAAWGSKNLIFSKNVDPIQKPKGPLTKRKITFRLIQKGKFSFFQASTKNG